MFLGENTDFTQVGGVGLTLLGEEVPWGNGSCSYPG